MSGANALLAAMKPANKHRFSMMIRPLQAKDVKDQAGKKAGELKAEAQKQAQPAVDQAKDAYGQASSKAQDVKQQVTEISFSCPIQFVSS